MYYADKIDISTLLYCAFILTMVMKTFRTDALEGLCTREQLDLLNSTDTLRSQGISHYISLPQNLTRWLLVRRARPSLRP